MKKLLLLLLLSLGLIGSTWAFQVSPTAIVFACSNTGLEVERVLYLRNDGRLCGENYNPPSESEAEAESEAEECPISIPVVEIISSTDIRCIEAEKKISSGEVFKSKVITYQHWNNYYRKCVRIDGENTQNCFDLKYEQPTGWPNCPPDWPTCPLYHPPPPIYVEFPIEISVLKCDGLIVDIVVGTIPQIITYEDGKICSEYFKGERCYENTDEAIEIGEKFVCSPYFESTDCYSFIEKYESVEKNLEPDNPMCLEAEKNK